jgi:hypothetical protein
MVNLLRTYCLFSLCVLCSIGVAQEEQRIRLGPQLLRAGDHGVGRLAEDVSFSDLSGKHLRLSHLTADRTATVIAMTSTSCPISQKYFPTLVGLAKTYAPRGIRFVIVNSISTDDQEIMRRAQSMLGADATYVFDQQGSFADALGAESTADVIVINESRTVVYHGAIDDQYGFGYSLEAARKTFLVDALDAILEKRLPAIEATAAPGCKLSLNKKQPSMKNITYHDHVSRLMQRHCVECHRDDGVAPFPLDTYDDVVSHSPMIREVVNRKIMPPWFAAAAQDHRPSPWANDRSLTNAETKELLAWIEGDQAEGDLVNAPQPLAFSDDWQIGKPDAVFAFDESIPVKATGIMPYKLVTIETDLDEDQWVQAIEIQPGERAVVHHVLVFVTPPGQETSTEAPQSDGINYWAIYVPGNGAQVYPEGYARLLPKGSRLTFQMHYTTNGTATEDRTRIGMTFADTPPTHEVKTAGIVNHEFKIDPGADNYQIVAAIPIEHDIQVLGFLPHHHLRGKASRYELISTNGETELLLDVPRYDFNWQLFYQYADPRIIHRGSTIRFTAWYDNSPNNPANPDPTRTVEWGQQTNDEMHLGYVEYTTVSGAKPGEDTEKQIPN